MGGMAIADEEYSDLCWTYDPTSGDEAAIARLPNA
jgi:hypothetical protein